MIDRYRGWQPPSWVYLAAAVLGTVMGAVLWAQPSAAQLLVHLPGEVPESIVNSQTAMAMAAGGIFGTGYLWLALGRVRRPARLIWAYPLLLIGTPLMLGIAVAVWLFIAAAREPASDVDWGMLLSVLAAFTVWPLRVTAPLGVASGLVLYALAKGQEARGRARAREA